MTDQKGLWLKVFCPESRCLTEAEIMDLPAETKAASQGRSGLWLEVFCPDQACLTPEEGGPELRPGTNAKGDEGLWLKLFCPSGSCQKTSGTELP